MMDIVKKNMVSIICGLVALLAIGAVFWPISGYYAELQDEAAKRKGVYDKLKQLGDKLDQKGRTLPVTDVSGPPTPVPLEQFPKQDVIDAWSKVTEQMKTESEQMFAAALEMNRNGHTVLKGISIPTARTSDFTPFRDEYRRLMETSNPATRKQTMVVQILNAGTTPTPAEVEAKRKQVDANMNAQGALLGLPPEEAKRTKERILNQVQEDLQQQVAEEIKVYARFDQNNGPLSFYPELSRTLIASPQDQNSTMFRAQVTLWVQQDVLKALASANSDAKNVKTSAVKYLASLRILDSSMKQFDTGPGGAAATPPPAPTTEPSQELKRSPLISMSGRYYNGVYDVIRFSLKILVDAEQVPRVLQELSKNQFITINNLSLQAVDVARWKADGYFFGDKPVVQLDISGEELLLRKWTMPLMPKGILVALGLDKPDAPSPAQ